MSQSDSSLQQHWIKIDTAALASNVHALKGALGSGPKLMAVVKANAYGHGFAIAPVLRDAGADAFGVTTLDEAVQVMESGVDSRVTPILLFAPLTQPEQVEYAIRNGLHLSVCDQSHLGIAVSAEAATGISARLHLKVDTGMGRLGLREEDALLVAKMRLSWAGVYTHFALAGEKDITSTRSSLERFNAFCDTCRENGIKIGLRHCANSAAALRLPQARLDMVRIGTALYGQMPSEYVPRPSGLSADTFQAQAQVVFVREIKPGETIGYGSEFTARAEMRAAVIPIGFADGFGVAPTSLYRGWRGVKQMLADRDPKRRPFVTINGERAYVLGRIAMQMIVVDVTDHRQPVKMGDIADIPMRRLSASALLPRRYAS